MLQMWGHFILSAEKILSAGMKNPGAMHPCQEDSVCRDEKSRDDASLARRFCLQGWKILGRCIPDEEILSAGMSSAENNNPYVSEKQKQDEWALWKASPDTEKAKWGCKCHRAQAATGHRQAPVTDSHLPEPKFQDKQEEGNGRYKCIVRHKCSGRRKLAGAIRRLSWSWKEPIIQKSIWD